jgi:hypothetical protein
MKRTFTAEGLRRDSREESPPKRFRPFKQTSIPIARYRF